MAFSGGLRRFPAFRKILIQVVHAVNPAVGNKAQSAPADRTKSFFRETTMPGPGRTVQLPDGTKVPAFGLGTWRMGERVPLRGTEISALRAGLDLGVRLIDTAEMYGEGEAEAIVGEAVAGRRDEVYIVSKVYPHNASRAGVVAACERSLKRLKTDRIDLYLLHWRGNHKLADTVAGFEALKAAGKIRAWGVSNLDVEDMDELHAVEGGKGCAVNQILYNVVRRGIEAGLLAWCRKHRVPIMAYSPLDQARIPGAPGLAAVAKRHGATPAQIMLACVARHPDAIVIPKAVRIEHLRANVAAMDLTLSAEDLADLDRAFPPPKRRVALEML
jgi:diketogulonate reductase-like aldo/keto reductase